MCRMTDAIDAGPTGMTGQAADATLWQRIGAARDDAAQVAAFGLVLYSRADVYLRKVLDDTDHTAALDALSGPRWTVYFSRIGVNPPLTGLASAAPAIRAADIVQQRLRESPNRAEQEPTASLLQALDLELDDLPCLLVFVPLDEDRAAVRQWPLDADSLEQAATSLRTAISEVTQVFERIALDNLKQPEGLLAALDLHRTAARQRRFLGRVLSILKLLRPYMPRLPV